MSSASGSGRAARVHVGLCILYITHGETQPLCRIFCAIHGKSGQYVLLSRQLSIDGTFFALDTSKTIQSGKKRKESKR